MAAAIVGSIGDALNRTHAVYLARAQEWRDTERRLRGGRDVLQELVAFDFAPVTSLEYRQRRRRARYVNFPDDIASMIVGHVLQASMTIDFGALGKVERAQGQTVPSNAELFKYNVDGVGNDASEWTNFWRRELRMAMATGHRWLYVDQRGQASRTVADVQKGMRPYVVGLSPLRVTDWEFEHNTLLYAIIRHRQGGRYLSNDPRNQRHPAYTLLVKQDFDEFGADFAAGGWWNFNADGELLKRDDGEPQTGDWSRTGGEIPMTPLYYDRDDGTDGEFDVNGNATTYRSAADGTLDPSEKYYTLPAMSKSGLFELGQLAIDYMNLVSAQSFDVWDAAKSIKNIMGVTEEQWAAAKKVAEAGSQWIPWGRDENGNVPVIADGSAGTVAPLAFKVVLDQIFSEVRYLASREIGVSADASGASKQATFTSTQSPRLSNMASEAENAMNSVIRFTEMRWTGTKTPSGVVKISRKFDVIRLATNVAEYFALERTSGLRSATLDAKAMVKAAKELGIMADDDDAVKIEKEFADSAAAAEQQKQQADLLTKEFQRAGDTSLTGA